MIYLLWNNKHARALVRDDGEGLEGLDVKIAAIPADHFQG